MDSNRRLSRIWADGKARRRYSPIDNQLKYLNLLGISSLTRPQLSSPIEGLAQPNLMKSCFISHIIVHITIVSYLSFD